VELLQREFVGLCYCAHFALILNLGFWPWIASGGVELCQANGWKQNLLNLVHKKPNQRLSYGLVHVLLCDDVAFAGLILERLLSLDANAPNVRNQKVVPLIVSELLIREELNQF
jgi:hypothetical protein